eukprot:2084534-Rhodomonas_salina.1
MMLPGGERRGGRKQLLPHPRSLRWSVLCYPPTRLLRELRYPPTRLLREVRYPPARPAIRLRAERTKHSRHTTCTRDACAITWRPRMGEACSLRARVGCYAIILRARYTLRGTDVRRRGTDMPARSTKLRGTCAGMRGTTRAVLTAR